MSTDAGLDLFKAVKAVLAADAYIASQCGTRIYSTWGNEEAAHPLIRMWAGDALPFELDGGGEGSETDFQITVFTAERGQTVARTIGNRVRDLLKDNDAMPLDGSNIVAFQFSGMSMIRDPEDPELQQAVVRFKAQTTTK